jgi:hypothetical protein
MESVVKIYFAYFSTILKQHPLIVFFVDILNIILLIVILSVLLVQSTARSKHVRIFLKKSLVLNAWIIFINYLVLYLK